MSNFNAMYFSRNFNTPLLSIVPKKTTIKKCQSICFYVVNEKRILCSKIEEYTNTAIIKASNNKLQL